MFRKGLQEMLRDEKNKPTDTRETEDTGKRHFGEKGKMEGKGKEGWGREVREGRENVRKRAGTTGGSGRRRGRTCSGGP